MDKQTVLELLANALAAVEQLTIDGLNATDPEAADAFGDMRGTIEHAMETVGYYAD
jgi:hypothetical protein